MAPTIFGFMNQKTLLFGGESPSAQAFFQTMLFRLALLYPFCAVASNSLTDVWDLLLIVFWILGGHWKERFRILKSSPILVVSLVLMFLSFVSVFQYESTFFQSLKYWRGHHPIPIIIVLSTVLTTQSRRVAMIGSLGLALLLGLSYSVAVRHGYFGDCFGPLKVAHVAKNTIWFGMSFVILAGLWICCPYVSRMNPMLRRCLGGRVRSSMRSAAKLSPARQLWSFFRHPFFVHLLCCVRWAVVLACLLYISLYNPSRTAIVAILCGISLMLLLWNWKAGIVCALCLFVPLLCYSHSHSSTFRAKAGDTVQELAWFKENVTVEGFEGKGYIDSRLGLYWNILKSTWKHPLGIGMERTRLKCLKYTNGRLDNVHNEFLSTTLHAGYQGGICFLLLFFYLFRQSCRMPPPWKRLGLYVAVTLFIDCMFNGALSQDMEGHFYCILIAVLASVDAQQHRPKTLVK